MGFGEERPPEALANYTGFLLSWVAAGSRRRFEAALEELGLRLPQFAVMNVISAGSGRTQKALVSASHIDASTMVQTLDALAAAGYAERRQHPSDRRKHTVHLTAEGKRMLRRGREAAKRTGEDAFGRLDPDERLEFRRLLRKSAGLDD